MSALSATRRRFPIGLVIAGIILWTCAVNDINDPRPRLDRGRALITAPNGHAVERHGQDAWTSIDWLEAHPATRRRIDCPGGNPVWHDTLPDGRVAVAVTTGGAWEMARNITAMLLSPRHFERFVRNCGGRLPAVVGPTREAE